MHGLINRAVQCFLRDTYGPEVWAEVADVAGIGPDGFEAMITYPDALTDAVLVAACAHLGKPRDAVLEDLGTYLVSLEHLRRLLRFGGVGYGDFLDTVEELPGRAQLAVPDLGLPQLRLTSHGMGRFTLTCRSPHRGFGHLMAGILRALADDYGALTLIDYLGAEGPVEKIGIELLEDQFTEGRRFELAGPVSGAVSGRVQ